MSIWQAILLGLVQGLTEFIPISSTAHLTLAGRMLGLIDAEHPEQWTAFMAVIQLGTLVAVVLYFWSDILNIIRGFIQANLARLTGRPVEDSFKRDAFLGWLVIAGTIPIAVVGLLFRHQIEGSLTKDLRVIAGSLIGLAIVLTVAEALGRHLRGMNELKFSDALWIGVGQVFALIPGSSRSGTTITAGLLVGLKREPAARVSFLLSMPAIAASGLLELPEVLRSGGMDWTAVAIATVVSAISGYLSIAFLLRYLQGHTTFVFVGYRIALGLLLIGLIATGRLSSQ